MRVVVQRVESFVNDHQTGLVQQDTRKDQILLFLIAEFLIPRAIWSSDEE